MTLNVVGLYSFIIVTLADKAKHRQRDSRQTVQFGYGAGTWSDPTSVVSVALYGYDWPVFHHIQI